MSKPACNAKRFHGLARLASVRGHVVFVDESGDLGISSRSTRSITICAVATGSCRRLEGIPGRVRRRLHVKKQKEKSELKFSNSSSRIRERALDSLATMEDVRVMAGKKGCRPWPDCELRAPLGAHLPAQDLPAQIRLSSQ